MGLLPRRCPVCGEHTIIGHGRRYRQAHDEHHEHIWVRRGVCHPCGKTFTILPDWLAPAAPFSLHCRQQACESIAAGASVEQAAPHCQDPSRLPDPSTLRRWAHRRLRSVCCWLKAGAIGDYFYGSPPSLPGIWTRSAVFCPSRQEVRESRSSRRVERTDSLDGLSACAGLAPGAAAQPWPMDGAVPYAWRSQPKLPGG